MLDYDKKFLIKSWDNLTFDGSSIRGFTAQRESDLRLGIDWSAFYWAPADFFGSGKVLVFGEVIDKGGEPYSADIRGVLKTFAEVKRRKATRSMRPMKLKVSCFRGVDAEQSLPRNRQVRIRQYRRLLSFAAWRSAAHVSLIPAPKCNARWAFRTRRTIRKLRLRSLKSTTAMAKWSRPRTRSSFTS